MFDLRYTLYKMTVKIREIIKNRLIYKTIGVLISEKYFDTKKTYDHMNME